jgi:hypothetical protein
VFERYHNLHSLLLMIISDYEVDYLIKSDLNLEELIS